MQPAQDCQYRAACFPVPALAMQSHVILIVLYTTLEGLFGRGLRWCILCYQTQAVLSHCCTDHFDDIAKLITSRKANMLRDLQGMTSFACDTGNWNKQIAPPFRVFECMAGSARMQWLRHLC